MKWIARALVTTGFGFVAFAASTHLGAQGAANYPTKPVRIVVPFPPGAFNDTLGRMLAQRFQEVWGQPAVVENKPGAGSLVGTEFAAKAPADGYTILIVALPFSVLQSLHPKANLDVMRDFVPIIQAGATPNVLVVNPGLPVNSIAEFIQLAKSKPGQLAYASSGAGSSNHLSMEMFKTMTGTDLVHVPYKGSAPAMTDLLAGQVQAYFDNAPNALPHVRAGKLRALAVTTANRSSFAPDLPTVAESGVAGYEITAWFGIVAPAGTPGDIVEKLNTEAQRFIALPETRDRFMKAGVEAVGGAAERFGQHLRSEVAKWAKVVKDSGAKVD
ncbi:MAG: tripartite tricarboxylate transporter substrate binding protein [Burkholderiales bacterium]